MAWKEDNVAEKRLEFIKMAFDERYSFTELCDRFGIARSNGYKWIDRYLMAGLEGLLDKRRGPRRSPLKTPEEIEAILLQERDRHPHWGAGKLLAVLARDMPDIKAWPARSTVHNILNRHGRVQSTRRRRKHEHPGKPFVHADQPNCLWAADFKGQFRLGDARICYPLTITDHHSRHLHACKALTSTKMRPARAVFLYVFREFGLPEAILTDNGPPFASTGIGGLTELSIWWLRLGIQHLRTQPSHPEQNGRHERMHRTLKYEATIPPKHSLRAQQAAFDHFRQEYNTLRPHDALDQATPASCYVPSPRPYPERLPPVDYPGSFVTRLVSSNGSIRWFSAPIFISKGLAGQHVGLEEVDDGIWAVYFAKAALGRLDVRTGTVK